MLNTISRFGVAGDAADYFCLLNPYFLESVIRLSAVKRVIASCDIFDEYGTMLLIKGEQVSQAHRATFLQRCLRDPLENCLLVEGGETLDSIVGDCLDLMRQNPVLDALGGASESMVALRGMGHMPLHGALQLLLTLSRLYNRSHYDKRLGAMIICAGLAHSAGLDDDDTDMLILSALVHDIGEMYIDPEYLNDERELWPDEWEHVASHPRIACAFLGEFTRFPTAVVECVLQHHERGDGSGYPFQLAGSEMSPLGKLAGVADTVSALVMRGDFGFEPGLCKRIEVALTLVSGEFPPPAVSFITTALARLNNDIAPAVSGRFAERVLPILQQIRTARRIAEAQTSSEVSELVARVSRFALEMIHVIDRSLHEIGAYDLSHVDVLEKKPDVMGEVCLLLGEVAWRLRHLARSIYLRVHQHGSASDQAQVARLVAALSEPVFVR